MTEGTTAKVHLEEQDWVEISDSMKRRESMGSAHAASHPCQTYDLILAVDCIYNEYLVRPFIDTLSYYCQPGSSTVVLVVVELRSSDVVSYPPPDYDIELTISSFSPFSKHGYKLKAGPSIG
jgi:hypothetical protein